MYIPIYQVQDFMAKLGIARGFTIETLRKNRRNGKFKVPYIKVGNTPCFKDKDILEWLEKQSKDG